MYILYMYNLAISVPFSNVSCCRLRTVDKRERLWPRELFHVEWSGSPRPPKLHPLAPRAAQQHCGRPGLSGHRVPKVRLWVGGCVVLREAFVHLRDELWPKSTDSCQSKHWNHNRIGVLRPESRIPKWRNELLLKKKISVYNWFPLHFIDIKQYSLYSYCKLMIDKLELTTVGFFVNSYIYSPLWENCL